MSPSKIFETLLVLLLLGLAMFIFLAEEVVIPGRVSMNTYIVEKPWTYFIAGAVSFFACAIALLNINRSKYKVLSASILLLSIALFGIGFFNANS